MYIKVKDVNSLKQLLIKTGFSQRALGRMIRVSETYINQLVNGERNPSPAVAKRMCDSLDSEFDDIFFVDTVNKSEHDTTNSVNN